MKKIRLAVAGYGNLGKAVIDNLANFDDFEFVGVVSRRADIDCEYPVFTYDEIEKLKGEADVVIMCGGSAFDLPVQSPKMAEYFNIVDSYDTHAKICTHRQNVDAAAKKAGTLAAISVGWDPGVFSLMRVLFSAVLPAGKDYTFWGKGVSQGHSDAIRKLSGIKKDAEGKGKAVQYTIPKDEAVERVRSGLLPDFSTKDKHLRECFVVVENGADKQKIENDIKTMPDYFADYDTVVHFISDEEFDKNHKALPHGGFVLRGGNTDSENKHLLEFSLKLDSNPQFTASVLLCYARAVKRLNDEGKTGCLTVLDIPYSYLSKLSADDLAKKYL